MSTKVLVALGLGFGVLSALAACGDSVTQGTSGSASSSTTSSGTTSSGMSSSGTTSSGMSSSGTTSSGMSSSGVTTSSGMGGATTTSSGMGGATTTSSGMGGAMSSSSGAGGGNPLCPPSQPMDMSMCSEPQGTSCQYGAAECNCGANGPMMMKTWHCHMCPAQEPMNGSMCADQGANCSFGADTCRCLFGQWTCGTCPGAEPMDGSNCMTPGLSCNFNNGSNCNCSMGGHWHCQDPCPANQPKPGDMCKGMQNCMYGMTNCLCIQGQFFCN